MALHNIIGQKGEELAVQFLAKKKYKIVERNWRYKKLELDIIALKDDLIVVVEVKTRSTSFVENLNEIITRKKQRYIINAANAYIEKKNLDCAVRFDVIFIIIDGRKYTLEHIKDAFSAVA